MPCSLKGIAKRTGNPREERTSVAWTLYSALVRLKLAVLRKCFEIRKHYSSRKFTTLVGVVSKEERMKYAPLALISETGTYSLSPAFTSTVEQAAQDAADARQRHRAAVPSTDRSVRQRTA